MVFLATSRRGYEAYISLNAGGALWVSAGILSPHELSELRARGYSVTNFSYAVSQGDRDAMMDAVSTIREHHPDETLWIEA